MLNRYYQNAFIFLIPVLTKGRTMHFYDLWYRIILHSGRCARYWLKPLILTRSVVISNKIMDWIRFVVRRFITSTRLMRLTCRQTRATLTWMSTNTFVMFKEIVCHFQWKSIAFDVCNWFTSCECRSCW